MFSRIFEVSGQHGLDLITSNKLRFLFKVGSDGEGGGGAKSTHTHSLTILKKVIFFGGGGKAASLLFSRVYVTQMAYKFVAAYTD